MSAQGFAKTRTVGDIREALRKIAGAYPDTNIAADCCAAEEVLGELAEVAKALAVTSLAATSAYRKYASRSRSVGRGVTDPFFSTRIKDFSTSTEYNSQLLRQLLMGNVAGAKDD